MNGVQIVALLAKLPLYQKFLSEYKNFAYIYMLFKKPEILNKIFKFIKRGKILSSHQVFIVFICYLIVSIMKVVKMEETTERFSNNPSIARQEQHERAIDTRAAPSPSIPPETNPFI